MPKPSKKDIDKAQAILDEIGQEDEGKAAKSVIHLQDEVVEQEKQSAADVMDWLEKQNKQKKQYQEGMAKLLYARAQNIDWPPDYKWRVGKKDDDKINLTFKKGNKGYGKGIKLTGEEKYDLHAMHIIATQCENTVDGLEGNLAWQQTESGVVTPGGVN